MIKDLLIYVLEAIIGFAGGLAVGAGFVSILTILGIIPRLTKLSKTDKLLKNYVACIVIGSLFGTYLSFTSISWNHPIIILILWGGIHGVFNGMLAAALTEILNVFPILSRRIGMSQYLLWLLMAIVFGKIAGSLFQWIILSKL